MYLSWRTICVNLQVLFTAIFVKQRANFLGPFAFFFNFKFQKTTFIWIVKRNSCKKFGCKRILSVEKSVFWKSYFRTITSAPNDPKMTLKATRPIMSHICRDPYSTRALNLTPFRPTITRFPEQFWFPYRVQWWMWNFQNFPNVVFWGPLGGKFRKISKPVGCDLQEE